MLGRYNMHNLTVGEYSDVMTFIRNYWWNFQESPKYQEICNYILGTKDDTFIIKTRQVGMSQFLIFIGVWLTIKTEKKPVRIAYYTPNDGLKKDLHDSFVDLMDSVDCDFKYKTKTNKRIRLENGTTIVFVSNPIEFQGNAPFDYIFFDEVDFIKSDKMDSLNSFTAITRTNTKIVFCSSLSKDNGSFYHYMLNDEEYNDKAIYFNWFDVPGRRKGLRLVNKDGLTHPNVILTEDSKIDHELYLALLKAGWILTSDWREKVKNSGMEYADEEIDCVSQQERNEIPWLRDQENNETNEEKEQNMFNTNLLDGVFSPEISKAIEQLTDQIYNLYNGNDTVTTSSTALKYNNFQYTNNNGEEKCKYHFQDTEKDNKDYCMLLDEYIKDPKSCNAQCCKCYKCEIPTMSEIEELVERPVCKKNHVCTCGNHTSMPGTNGQTAKIGMNSCVNHSKDNQAAFAKASNELLNEAENKSKEMMKPTDKDYKDVMDAYKDAKQENKEAFKLNEKEINEAEYNPVKDNYKKMYENHLKKRGLTDEQVRRRHNIDIEDYIAMGKRLYGKDFGIIEKEEEETPDFTEMASEIAKSMINIFGKYIK